MKNFCAACEPVSSRASVTHVSSSPVNRTAVLIGPNASRDAPVHSADLMTTVAIAALEAEICDPAFCETFGDYNKVVGSERQRPVNALSVGSDRHPARDCAAQAGGAVKKGVLAEKDGGYIYNPGVLQASAHRMEAFERGMRDTLQFINDCLKFGLLQLAPKTGRQSHPAKLRQ